MFFNHDNSFTMNDLYDAHPKHVLNLVKSYCLEIMKHPRVYLEFKEKRSNAIDQACIHYGKVYDVIALMNPLNCSYLLGHSELIVAPFTEECAKLLGAIEVFEGYTAEATKQCQEVNEWYKPIFKMLDKKMVVSCFLNDVEYWSSSHGFQYDKSALVAAFNDIKKDHITYLKKIHEKKK